MKIKSSTRSFKLILLFGASLAAFGCYRALNSSPRAASKMLSHKGRKVDVHHDGEIVPPEGTICYQHRWDERTPESTHDLLSDLLTGNYYFKELVINKIDYEVKLTRYEKKFFDLEYKCIDESIKKIFGDPKILFETGQFRLNYQEWKEVDCSSREGQSFLRQLKWVEENMADRDRREEEERKEEEASPAAARAHRRQNWVGHNRARNEFKPAGLSRYHKASLPHQLDSRSMKDWDFDVPTAGEKLKGAKSHKWMGHPHYILSEREEQELIDNYIHEKIRSTEDDFGYQLLAERQSFKAGSGDGEGFHEKCLVRWSNVFTKIRADLIDILEDDSFLPEEIRNELRQEGDHVRGLNGEQAR